MNQNAIKALDRLNKKLGIIKQESFVRNRHNLLQSIEECIALLDIIDRNK